MNARKLRTAMAVFTALAGASGAMASESANLDAARAAITAADKDVAEARDNNALWTTAEEALRRAKRALESGDAAGASEQARIASGQARLGIAQKRLPLTRWEP